MALINLIIFDCNTVGWINVLSFPILDTKDAEELRKQRLIDDNKADEKTIKKLEKELHFHKNKKTKKKTIPSIFKADGLDCILL